RQVVEAERRPSREIPALRVRGHDRGGAPPARGRAQRESSAARDGHVDGRDAHVAVGRALSRHDGRADAAGESALAVHETEPGLDKNPGPLLAANPADALVNPPEQGILEREIKRVPHGRAVVIPLSARTAGHGTHTIAAVWKSYLAALLRESEPSR